MYRHLGESLRRCARGQIFLLTLVGLAFSFADHASADTPNIVYILADDMGLGDIRSYNANSPVNTPNIDRIANEGMRFTNARSPSSVCSPTRYGILTGRYPWRGALTFGVVREFRPSVLEPSRLTVAEMLQQKGYATAALGKWHLGLNWQTTDGFAPNAQGTNVDYTKPFTGGPINNGFDTYYGDDVINWPPYTMIRDDRTIGIPVGNVNGQPYTPPGGVLPGYVTPGYTTAGSLPLVLNETESYIAGRATQPAPFFLYLPLTAPHEPIVPPPELQGSTGTNAYGDFIATVDWAVGRVLDRLEDPNGDNNTSDSILDNTMIVFTADNGAETHFSFSTSPGFKSGLPLRGDKATVYEGGHAIPLMVKWDGEVQPGSVSSQMVELNDFMATVADIVDYQLPLGAAEDSFNLAPLLRGDSNAPVRNAGVQISFSGAAIIRQIDSAGNEWKLIFSPNDGGFGGTTISPFAPITNFGQLQMFNLTADPSETTNLLAGGGTEPTRQKALALQALLLQMINAGRTAPTVRTGDYNGDHVVDASDYLAWKAAFGSATVSADGNNNGIVDLADFVIWRKNFLGQSTAGSGALVGANVPEPAASILAAAAIFFGAAQYRPRIAARAVETWPD
ncbi:MAG TPA: sulfatase-like hydrolase/transferase [Lacipirellulaceae bacterium]|nr:sulfatase-like hydrolase/transferase [Lacipirellulaceae bacterium]